MPVVEFPTFKHKGGLRDLRQTDPAFRQRKAENWPCYRHRAELIQAQGGRCGIYLGPDAAGRAPDEWRLNRIRPEGADGRWEQPKCQVAYRKCGRRKGAMGREDGSSGPGMGSVGR